MDPHLLPRPDDEMGLTRSPSAASATSQGSRAASVDLADDLLSRLNQALAGAGADESDVSLSLSYTENTNRSSIASPPSLSNPPSLSTTPFVRPATAAPGAAAGAKSLDGSTAIAAAHLSLPAKKLSPGSSSGSVRKRPQSAGVGGLRGWGDGDDDDFDEASCRDGDDEEPGDKILIHLEIREAVNLPQAMARSTGECYVELQRQTQRGTFARLNPTQSRVRSVKTSRMKRTWGETRSDRLVRWSGGQCLDVQASSRDTLVFGLWDYKTIGSCLNVGYARLECGDIAVGGDKVMRNVPVCDKRGQDVLGSNGQTAQISVSIAAVPIIAEVRMEREWSEEATTAERTSSKVRLSQIQSNLLFMPTTTRQSTHQICVCVYVFVWVCVCGTGHQRARTCSHASSGATNNSDTCARCHDDEIGRTL